MPLRGEMTSAACLEPAASVSHLEIAMMLVGLRAQADLFYLDLRLCLASFPFFLGAFVDELAEIHDPANRRISRSRHLYQV